MNDFDEAIDRLIAGLEKKRVMSTREREIVAYHEAGHAIVASILPNMDPVHKISIVARGFGALGYTMQLPLEDRYLLQRGDLLNQMAILLGGRAAEEIAVGEISTGAQNDLQRVTDVARSMVTEWGMSEKLGTVNYDQNRRGRFLDLGMPAERGLYSEETARVIDEEVKQIIAGAHEVARRILRENRDILERVTRFLLEKEVMEGDELRAMMNTPARRESLGRSGPRLHGTFQPASVFDCNAGIDIACNAVMAPIYLGEFEYAVLLAILHLDEDAYAVPIRELIEQRTGRPVARGALYTGLDRLEAKGCLKSRMGDPPKSAAARRAATTR